MEMMQCNWFGLIQNFSQENFKKKSLHKDLYLLMNVNIDKCTLNAPYNFLFNSFFSQFKSQCYMKNGCR